MKTLLNSALALLLILNVASAQEMMKPGPEHKFLAESEGEWTVKMEGVDDSVGKATYKMAHGGLWLTSTLDMKMPFGPFTGQGLDSYDPVTKKFTAIWVDSMSATPIILSGERSQDGKKITMTGKGPAPDGSMTDYKTETEYVSKDKHIFKMWMSDLAGQPMMVATYERKK